MANYFQTDNRDDYFASLHKRDHKPNWEEKYNKLNNPMEELKKKIEILLNEDQNKSIESMETWAYNSIKTRDENLFYKLTGAAGTGKTTVLDTFLKKLRTPFSPHRVCICAPTHKAKKVMKQKTSWDNAETLQALLGLKLDTNLDDFDVNNPTFNPIGDRKIKDYDLVIIDESSMINTELYITICDCAKATGSKVMFVGDIKQLNPVKEYAISPALISPIHGYNLTQIVRQSNTNPLILLLDIIRDDIENKTNKHIQYMIENPKQFNEKGEGYSIVKGEEFARELTTGFKSKEFIQDKNYCRYISWTNDSISKTNKWIRDTIFACKENLQVGELILSYKTLAVKEFLVITNSDDYIVQALDEGGDNDYGIKTWVVKLLCIDTDKVSIVNVVVPNEQNYERFIDEHEDLVDRAKSSRAGRDWVRYYTFRDSFTLLEPLTTKRYGKQALVTKKDLDYGYGITIHKSQGSTYNTVFVNGKDINRNSNDAERLKLWYVALSRASNKVIINI